MLDQVLSEDIVKILCTGCASKIDITDQVCFTVVDCPACNTSLTIPKQVGDLLLIEKIPTDGSIQRYCGFKNDKTFAVKVFTPPDEAFIHELSEKHDEFAPDTEIFSDQSELYILRPWYHSKLEALSNSKTEITNESLFRILFKVCDALEAITTKGLFFNEIDPNSLYLDNNELKLSDAVLLELVDNLEASAKLANSVRETGKIINFLLFDHSENYSAWTKKNLSQSSSNFYQFPWILKQEKFNSLKELVRKMILTPEKIESYAELNDKLHKLYYQIDSVTDDVPPQKENKQKSKVSGPQLNAQVQKTKLKVNRARRASKKSQAFKVNPLVLMVIIIAAVGYYLVVEQNILDHIFGSEQETTAQVDDLEKQRELARLAQIAKDKELQKQRELERIAEAKKQKELQKQRELKAFLSLIQPSDETLVKYKSMPKVSSTNLAHLLKKHCTDCHNAKKRKGDFALDVFKTPQAIFQDYELIKHAYESIKAGDMPPEDEDITDEQRQQLTHYFEKIIYTLESKQVEFNSTTLIRRLTPYEYDYTVKDITGLDLNLGKDFPGDGGGNQGFSNDAKLMSVSPIQLEKYIEAAETISSHSSFDIDKGLQFNQSDIAHLSIADYETSLENKLYSFYKIYPKNFNSKVYLYKLMKASAAVIFNKGKRGDIETIAAKHRVAPIFLKRAVDYFSTSASKSSQGIDALKKWQKLKFLRTSDTKEITKATNDAVSTFLSSFQVSKSELYKKQSNDRRKHTKFVENVESLIHLDKSTAAKHLSGQQLADYNRTLEILNFLRFSTDKRNIVKVTPLFEPIIYRFLYKVYRRPPDKGHLHKMVKDFLNDSLKYGIPLASRVMVIRAFSSFHFTFRIEQKTSKKVSDYDLASRLSYFLWAGPPDEQLLKLASTDNLNNEETLNSQIIRMLKDPKSDRLAKHFASQWLRFDGILSHDAPTEDIYKGFSKELANDMWQETAMSFNYMVKNDHSVLDIFNADFSFINGRLSKLYGLGERTNSFKKVSFNNGQRGGILGHASILTMTSFGQRTSPIIRGNWVLSVLLGTPTPPPPMDVVVLPEEDIATETFTLKNQLKKHRDNPACRGCHKKIDPLGLVLENYDVVGRWRTHYKNAKVDATSEISGHRLENLDNLKSYLMQNKVKYLRNLSKKLLSYSLGRSIYYYDNFLINKMIENTIRDDFKFSSLVKTVISSPQFQLK